MQLKCFEELKNLENILENDLDEKDIQSWNNFASPLSVDNK